MVDVSDRLARLSPSEASLAGYLFWLSRPRFWLYLAGPVVVGVVYAAGSPSEFFQPVTVALFGYFLVPANVFLYGVNDLFDADIDELNPKKAAEGREVRYRHSSGVLAAVIVSALLASAFVPLVPAGGLLALGGFLALGAAYSAPPVRFKTTPVLDSVSNGLYILPGVVAFTAVAGSYPPALGVAGGWTWAMGMHTFSAIPDIEPDRAAGIRTAATVLGETRTYGYCFAAWTAAAVAFALVDLRLGALLFAYPVFVTWVARSSVAVDRAYWWFPALNTVVGTLLSMGGLWRVYPLWEVLP